MKIDAVNELTVEDKHCNQKWGFKVKELYKLALRFYKGELEALCFLALELIVCSGRAGDETALKMSIRVCSSLFTLELMLPHTKIKNKLLLYDISRSHRYKNV